MSSKQFYKRSRVFVRNLSYHCTEDDLKQLFHANGLHALFVDIKKGYDTQKPLHYGSVALQSTEEVQRAIDCLSGRLHLGRRLE